MIKARAWVCSQTKQTSSALTSPGCAKGSYVWLDTAYNECNCLEFSFQSKVKKNVHVVLAFSPVGDGFRSRKQLSVCLSMGCFIFLGGNLFFQVFACSHPW